MLDGAYSRAELQRMGMSRIDQDAWLAGQQQAEIAGAEACLAICPLVTGIGDVASGAYALVRLSVGRIILKDTLDEGTTFLCQKLSAEGEHLKFGVTSDLNGRYTSGELAGGRLKALVQGSREEMLQLERSLHEVFPSARKKVNSIIFSGRRRWD